MASTLFSPGVVVQSPWLNEVDTATHNNLSAVTGTNTITAVGPVSYTAYLTGGKFRFIPQNTNSGAVTININGLGARNIILPTGGALTSGQLVALSEAEIYYDGTNFQLLNPAVLPISMGGTGQSTALPGRLLNVRTFTSGSGIYTPTAGTASIIVEVCGGGGGGGGGAPTGASQISAGTGGGGGSFARSYLTTGFSGVAYSVGAGGVGVAAANGTNGGASSFGAITAGGGTGGTLLGPSTVLSGANGPFSTPATGGNLLNLTGGQGGSLFSNGIIGFSGGGGSSFYGPAVNSGLNCVYTSSSSSGSSPNTTPGTGGCGARVGQSQGTGAAGGAGVPGIIFVYEYS